MSIVWAVILILGLIAIFAANNKPKGSEEWRSSTFWFLLAFWAYLVLAPWAGHVLATT